MAFAHPKSANEAAVERLDAGRPADTLLGIRDFGNLSFTDDDNSPSGDGFASGASNVLIYLGAIEFAVTGYGDDELAGEVGVIENEVTLPADFQIVTSADGSAGFCKAINDQLGAGRQREESHQKHEWNDIHGWFLYLTAYRFCRGSNACSSALNL